MGMFQCKTVHGPTEVDELPVDLGAVHLLSESGDVVGAGVLVIRTVEYQQAGLDHPRFGGE